MNDSESSSVNLEDFKEAAREGVENIWAIMNRRLLSADAMFIFTGDDYDSGFYADEYGILRAAELCIESGSLGDNPKERLQCLKHIHEILQGMRGDKQGGKDGVGAELTRVLSSGDKVALAQGCGAIARYVTALASEKEESRAALLGLQEYDSEFSLNTIEEDITRICLPTGPGVGPSNQGRQR